MHLLNIHTLTLETFHRPLVPPYAIASHRWNDAESTFQDVQAKRNLDSLGFKKIEQFTAFVRANIRDVSYLWIDTCCIDKTNSQELQEAITAMYKWYKRAEVCLAYLQEVTNDNEINQSVWFTRGWTLQELLAPDLVVFLSNGWDVLGHKAQDGRRLGFCLDDVGPMLNSTVAEITGVPKDVLAEPERAAKLSTDEKFKWMARRTTTRPEDMAYSMIGLFGVSMPLIYEEGQSAAERRLRQAIADTQGRSFEPETQQEAREIDGFLQRLYTHAYPYEDRKNRNAEPVKGTCQWFLKQEMFQNWSRSEDSHPLLYVTADPGCGKSVLSRYLIDTILPHNGTIVCYAFFKDDFEDQKTSVGAACALLHQVLCLDRHLFRKESQFLQVYRAQGERFFNSFRQLWTAFQSVARHVRIYCVLDALDECQEQHRDNFIMALSKTAMPNLRVLITCRPYDHLMRTVRRYSGHDITSLHIQGHEGPIAEEIVQEILLVVRHRVDETAICWRLSSSERALLEETILKVPNRTYLWVTLVFDGLMTRKKGIKKQDILNLTAQLPMGIYEAYEKLLSRSQDENETKKLLSLVIAAKRPFVLSEISISLAYDDQQTWSKLELDVIPLDRVGDHIRDLCGLLVSIVDQKVYLLHQTAREFLLERCAELSDVSSPPVFGKDLSLRWQHSITLTDANAVLVDLCLRILSLYLQAHDLKYNDSSSQYNSMAVYAATFWLQHYRQTSAAYRKAAVGVLREFCSRPEKYAKWIPLAEPQTAQRKARIYPIPSPLFAAAYFGFHELTAELLQEYSRNGNLQKEINCVHKYPLTPLSLAAKHGHQEVVRVLLATGKADVNAVSASRMTPLHQAAVQGNQEVVKQLLAVNGILVNTADTYGETPLHYAATMGCQEIVKQLLEVSGILVDAEDCGGETPLHVAAIRNDPGTIELLLGTEKVRVNAIDKRGYTPFHSAIRKKCEETAKVLFATGQVDLSLKNVWDVTPLDEACMNGLKDIVEILLATGHFDLNALDLCGRSLLSRAISSGHNEIVEMLLAAGAVRHEARPESSLAATTQTSSLQRKRSRASSGSLNHER